MRVYIDHQKVNARAALANAASIGGLLLLLVSVVLPLFVPVAASLAVILLAAGGMIAMVGIYLANRWVRRPRPEESLDKALKAFDDHYRLYHYPSLPCDHILLTPSGVTALEVVNLGGSFSNRGGHWKEAMTIGRALRYLVEQRVIDPPIIARGMTEELQHSFQKQLGASVAVPIKVLTVFSHPAVILEIEGPSYPACKMERLRKQATLNADRLTDELYDQLALLLEHATMG